jgi:putative oxidoreductase
MKFLADKSELLYGLLRIVAGFLFLCHGAQKIFGVFGGTQVELISQIGLAGVIELVGGALILIGLWTRWAAFLASGLMAVAYFLAHAGDALLPIQNRGELAVIYSFLFLYIASRGSGKLSVASALKKRGLD